MSTEQRLHRISYYAQSHPAAPILTSLLLILPYNIFTHNRVSIQSQQSTNRICLLSLKVQGQAP